MLCWLHLIRVLQLLALLVGGSNADAAALRAQPSGNEPDHSQKDVGSVRDHGRHSQSPTSHQAFLSPSGPEPTRHEEVRDDEPFDTIDAMVDALEVMQSSFFQLWQGTWPTAIDWTAAVLGTHMSAALSSLSSLSLGVRTSNASAGSTGQNMGHTRSVAYENLLNKYFSQLMSFYFGQSAFSLRHQAYDDMLWVVLGWLESVQFIMSHSSLHHNASVAVTGEPEPSQEWYGTQFIPALAHRARIFYDLASRGWDTRLCGGGMIWNPSLKPYKNAITNELFIAASVAMYLYFPGDNNTSPFAEAAGLPPAKGHDPKYLGAALDAYDWLVASNMTNAAGLYVDGYHIRGDGRPDEKHNNTNCDIRNEMVYTYNQGVLLSGLRGLWDSTGMVRYLEDGHALITSVTRATGWVDDYVDRSRQDHWAGLGRGGVLEEFCDASASCSQDGQTFKGIFFHHLMVFCSPLRPLSLVPGFVLDQALLTRHQDKCTSYRRWVAHNAHAAYRTRDAEGRFGMWWGRHYPDAPADSDAGAVLPLGALDYRNVKSSEAGQGSDASAQPAQHSSHGPDTSVPSVPRDVNDRGRGRTVETQSGGLAVLRAMWEISKSSDQGRARGWEYQD